MNVDELYKYIIEKTGVLGIHLGLTKNEFTKEEADEIVSKVIELKADSNNRSVPGGAITK